MDKTGGLQQNKELILRRKGKEYTFENRGSFRVDKKYALEAIKSFTSELRKQIRIEKLILFGSYASGAQREDSDIDIVIISPDFEKMDFMDRLELLGRTKAVVFEPIDAMGLTPEEWESGEYLISDFAKEGEVVKI